jgi:Spy/CpxP family protein refolding chaperone
LSNLDQHQYVAAWPTTFSERTMKILIASVLALSLLGAASANASIVGAHVGPVGVHIGGHHHHCFWRHHHRVCR